MRVYTERTVYVGVAITNNVARTERTSVELGLEADVVPMTFPWELDVIADETVRVGAK